MPSEFRELLSKSPARDALHAVHEPGKGNLGRKRDQYVHVVGFAVELHNLAFKVGSDLSEYLLHPSKVPVREHAMPILSHEDQVSVKGENAVPPGTNSKV